MGLLKKNIILRKSLINRFLKSLTTDKIMISSGYQRLGEWYADKINRRYFPEFAYEVAREIIAGGAPFNLLPLSVGGSELQEFARRSTSRKTLIDYYKDEFPKMLESTERVLSGEPMFYGIDMDELSSQLKE